MSSANILKVVLVVFPMKSYQVSFNLIVPFIAKEWEKFTLHLTWRLHSSYYLVAYSYCFWKSLLENSLSALEETLCKALTLFCIGMRLCMPLIEWRIQISFKEYLTFTRMKVMNRCWADSSNVLVCRCRLHGRSRRHSRLLCNWNYWWISWYSCVRGWWER